MKMNVLPDQNQLFFYNLDFKYFRIKKHISDVVLLRYVIIKNMLEVKLLE